MDENKTQIIVLAAVAIVAVVAMLSAPSSTTGNAISFRDTVYTEDRCQELETGKAASFSFNRLEATDERTLWSIFGCMGENTRQRQPEYLCYSYRYENGYETDGFYIAQCSKTKYDGIITTTITEEQAINMDPNAYEEVSNRQIRRPAR